MSNEPVELKNAVARSIEQDPRSGRYELHLVLPNPLAPGQFIERTVTLWHTKPNSTAPDSSTIEQTQDALRKSLGDQAITFSYPLNLADPNNIQTWLTQHPNANVTDLFQNGRYLQLGNSAQSDQLGSSRYLKLWDPKSTKNSSVYDPSANFVRLFDALPMHLQKEISDQNFRGKDFRTSRTGNVYMTVDEVVDHVIFARANGYETTSQDMSCRDVAADMVRAMQNMATSTEAKNICQEIITMVQQNKPYGFGTLVKLVGGMAAPRLKNDSVLNGAVKNILENVSRGTLQMYVRNLETGYIHRVSSFKYRSEMGRNDTGLEFSLADYQPSDVDDFLLNGLGLAPSEIINIAKTNGLTKTDQDMEVPNRDTVNDALKLFNAILENREVSISTMVASSHGVRDITMLPAYVRSFGAQLDDSTVKAKIAQNIQAEQTNAVAQSQTPAAPKATVAPFGAPAQNTAQPVNNTQTDPNLDPFAAPAPQTPEPTANTTAPAAQPTAPTANTTAPTTQPANDPFAAPAPQPTQKPAEAPNPNPFTAAQPSATANPFAQAPTQSSAPTPAQTNAPTNDPFAAPAPQAPSEPSKGANTANDPFAVNNGAEKAATNDPFAKVNATEQPNPFAQNN